MNAGFDDDTMRAAFALAREAEPSDADIHSVLGRAATRRSFFRSAWAPLALAAAVAVPSAALALPPVRDAFGDVAGTFSSFFSGDDSGDVPGLPIDKAPEAPGWLTSDPGDEARVIASIDSPDGHPALYVSRSADGEVSYGLDDSFGYTDTAEAVEQLFADHFLFPLGSGSVPDSPTRTPFDSQGQLPLYGVTARDVAYIELTYESGPPTRADSSRGGYAVLADPLRFPRSIDAYDGSGDLLESAPAEASSSWDALRKLAAEQQDEGRVLDG